jgi:hypothetical protein
MSDIILTILISENSVSTAAAQEIIVAKLLISIEVVL